MYKERSPERYSYSGWWRRAFAMLIDTTLATCVAFVAGTILLVASGSSAETGVRIFLAGFLAAGLCWTPAFMARKDSATKPEKRRNGQSLGKQALGIRVVKANGEEIGFLFALGREAGLKGLVPVLLNALLVGFLLVPVDYLWPVWDLQNRALHDMVAGTHVTRAVPVSEEQTEALGPPPPPPQPRLSASHAPSRRPGWGHPAERRW